jgi:hypothetical protein
MLILCQVHVLSDLNMTFPYHKTLPALAERMHLYLEFQYFYSNIRMDDSSRSRMNIKNITN